MLINESITPRALSYEEKENRKKGIFDSFANYLVFCPKCHRVMKTNMYLQSAEIYLERLIRENTPCPECGRNEFVLGYPLGSKTGFVKYHAGGDD